MIQPDYTLRITTVNGWGRAGFNPPEQWPVVRDQSGNWWDWRNPPETDQELGPVGIYLGNMKVGLVKTDE